MVGGGHNLVLSLGLGDGNACTRGFKRGCPKKDGKNNNKKRITLFQVNRYKVSKWHISYIMQS